MKKSSNLGLLIATVILSLLLVVAVAFGVWAFMGRNNYKYNSDQISAAAVTTAVAKNSVAKDKVFAEKEKFPLKDYRGPSAYGSVKISYPKTWSAYVDETANGSNPIDGYFSPGFVAGIADNASYALRIKVVNSAYVNEIKQYDSLVKAGKVSAAPYIPAKIKTVTGMRFDGQLINNKVGSLVMVPVRDKTLMIWTEAPDFASDFNNTILPNYTFDQ
jgi:hypothetical protein